MTLRVCIYKNCEKFINLKDRSLNKDVKLFSFPKNEERRKKWIEFGKVPPDLPPSMYYFCAEHFDKKFMAVNNRRTVLVGEAVPFPYVEPEIDETFQVDSNIDYYLYDENEPADNPETHSEQELHVESTTMQDDDSYGNQEEYCSINLDNQDSETGLLLMQESKESTGNSRCYKRKYDNDTVLNEPSTSKPKMIKISASVKQQQKLLDKTNIKPRQIINSKGLPVGSTTALESLSEDIEEEHFSIDIDDIESDSSTRFIEVENDLGHNSLKKDFEDVKITEGSLPKSIISKFPVVKIVQKSSHKTIEGKKATECLKRSIEEIDEDCLIDAKHVTTFVFKGEEHVQMTKDYYIREKMENTKNLKKMLHIVKTVKEYLNGLDV